MPQPRKRKPVTLRDRMDALTHSVELLASMHRDTEKHMRELAEIVKPIARLVLEHEERLDRLEEEK